VLATAGPSSVRRDALKNWQVVVKPVRASRESCVKCHDGKPDFGPPPIKGLKLGDPLGYLVYLFRSA
jgi:hypothetical protein